MFGLASITDLKIPTHIHILVWHNIVATAGVASYKNNTPWPGKVNLQLRQQNEYISNWILVTRFNTLNKQGSAQKIGTK